MTDRVLGDDHIDLLVSAALRWRVLGSTTTAAFSAHNNPTHTNLTHSNLTHSNLIHTSPTDGTSTDGTSTGGGSIDGGLESRILGLTATQAGRAVRDQNGRAILALSQQGVIAMSERVMLSSYDFKLVETIEPVEVLKAIQAARELCRASPDWVSSPARRLLDVLADSATCRLPGYAVAPWHWTRPEGHQLGVVGICAADDGHPDIERVQWVDVERVGEAWEQAAVVLISVPAALQLPVGLASRPGLHLVTWDPIDNDRVWAAVTAVGQQALVLTWPYCRDWLAELVAGAPQPVSAG